MLQVLTDQIKSFEIQTAELARKQAITHLSKIGKEIIETEVAKLDQFNPDQQRLIVERLDPRNFFERISDPYDRSSVETVMKSAVKQTADDLDKTIRASLPTENRPIFDSLRGTSKATLKNLHEHAPPQDREMYHKVNDEVMDRIKKHLPRDAWVMPEDHANMKHLKQVMDRYYAKNYDTLLQETNQSHIGGRIATIGAVVIPIAWRLITAFQVCDLEPMDRRILDKKIKRWSADTTSTDVVTDYANLDPGEGGTITSVDQQYINFPIYSTRQSLRSKITPEAIATAMSTPMMPMMDTVEGLAQDIIQRVDTALWWRQIIGAMMQNNGQVTSAETFTQVGSTNTWRSANKAWIPYAWQKTVDTEGNPTAAKFENLFPAAGESAAPTGLGTQGIALTASHASGTDAALLYNTDYTIDFMNGEITLTAAGETKRAAVHASAAVVGTYSYTNNINTWSQATPSGMTFVEHILTLRRAIGKSKVNVFNRNWRPSYLAVTYDLEDIISQGDRMTALGGTPADLLNRMNEVLLHAGLETVRTNAFSNEYGIVGQLGACCHAVQIPWSFGDVLTDWTTGAKYILGNQFSGSDVPVNDMLSLIGITA